MTGSGFNIVLSRFCFEIGAFDIVSCGTCAGSSTGGKYLSGGSSSSSDRDLTVGTADCIEALESRIDVPIDCT